MVAKADFLGDEGDFEGKIPGTASDSITRHSDPGDAFDALVSAIHGDPGSQRERALNQAVDGIEHTALPAQRQLAQLQTAGQTRKQKHDQVRQEQNQPPAPTSPPEMPHQSHDKTTKSKKAMEIVVISGYGRPINEPESTFISQLRQPKLSPTP